MVICRTFLHDAACHILLIDVSQSYSESKKGDVVVKHGVVMCVVGWSVVTGPVSTGRW